MARSHEDAYLERFPILSAPRMQPTELESTWKERAIDLLAANPVTGWLGDQYFGRQISAREAHQAQMRQASSELEQSIWMYLHAQAKGFTPEVGSVQYEVAIRQYRYDGTDGHNVLLRRRLAGTADIGRVALSPQEATAIITVAPDLPPLFIIDGQPAWLQTKAAMQVMGYANEAVIAATRGAAQITDKST